MRHTLLPIYERKALRMEYDIRLFVVFCFLISVAGLIGVAALFPSYWKATLDEKTQLEAADKLKRDNDASGQTTLENKLKADQAVLTKLLSKTSQVRVSKSIEDLLSLRGNVKLSSFSFDTVASSSIVVVIQGQAPTRNDLLAFKSRLEDNLTSSKAELPFSELAKSKDIEFSMKVSYKPK